MVEEQPEVRASESQKRRARRKRQRNRAEPEEREAIAHALTLERKRKREKAPAKELIKRSRAEVVLSRPLQTIDTPRPTFFGMRTKALSFGVSYAGLPKLLAEHEESMREKMGPRNLYSPDKLIEAIANYKRKSDSDKAAPFYWELLPLALELHDDLNLYGEVLPSRVALEAMLAKNKSTSAGYPYYARRSSVCYQYLPAEWISKFPEAADIALQEWNDLGRPDVLTAEPNNFYVVNYRTEAGRDGCKVRLVHAAPLAMQLLESRYALPIVQALRCDSSRPEVNQALDVEHGEIFSYMSGIQLTAVIQAMIEFAQSSGTEVISMDYSQFDATISSTLIKLGFTVLFGDPENWDENQQLIVENFTNKRLITPFEGLNEVLFRGGVPSGSVFTNLIDTSVNALIATYVCQDMEFMVRCNGDDGVLVTSEPLDLNYLEGRAATLGVDINHDKQAVSPDSCLFNKQYFDLNTDGPIPSANRIINSMRYYDSMMKGRKVMNASEEIIRTLQLVQMMQFHPCRDEFLALISRPTADDGYSFLDYRLRLPIALEVYGRETDAHIDPSMNVQKLDDSWISEVYNGENSTFE